MNIYAMHTDFSANGLPRFSWKCKSGKRGDRQTEYRINVSKDCGFSEVVWDSGSVMSDSTLYIKYAGIPLAECEQYFWRVCVKDSVGEVCNSETAVFETFKNRTDKAAWEGADWIGAPTETINTDGLREFKITARFTADKTAIAANARNKDNCTLFEFDMEKLRVTVYDVCDNAWSGRYNDYTTNAPYKRVCGNGDGYEISTVYDGAHEVQISVENDGRNATVSVDGVCVIDSAPIMPRTVPNQPYREFMFNWGICQSEGSAEYHYIKVETGTGNVLCEDNFEDDSGAMSVLGTVTDGKLIVRNEFNLTSAVPGVNVRKRITIKGTVKKARLYSAAMGFYEVYINGEKVGEDFYNPGFTDYRKRIMYRIYDVTDMLNNGVNSLGATVAKGYWSGYLGYNQQPMIYGRQNYFIAQLVVEYTDGTREIISTDKTWEFTDKCPVVDADYLQGEIYDARLEFDWNDFSDKRWRACGVGEWPKFAGPTNGVLKGVEFELCPQYGPTARVERVIVPVADCVEAPRGHFVYDFGQNMVGTVRLKMKAERGQSIKLRFGEMCYKNGEVYIENLRTAGNTDVYTFRGDADGEVFVPSFTSHGFRYVEITGNGCELTKGDIKDIVLEGLVITNTTENTGTFECSDELVNKLQSNIQWGQRGNSLLVFTDCPQRNERMGWTGDAQVFAGTAAYNMDVREFMDKWLCDVRDGQLLYNRNGAVPDTAPLGGDNRRTGGCAGWGDAAVIVPWEMYRAYGDVAVLEDNYQMMLDWVEYQNRDDRKNCGMRTVAGMEVPEQSDLATIPYIQCQQSRGDHLTFDETTPFILTATAYAAYVAYLVSEIAKILGKTTDAEKYRERYENIRRAFNEAWVCEDGSLAYWGEMSKSNTDVNGNVINCTYYSDKSENRPSQTAYALAIDFGLIDSDKIAYTMECFKRSIDDRNGHLSVGFLGISHLMPALTKCGFDETAFALLMQQGYPGWLYSVINGATTIWERWNSYVAETDTFGNVSMNSFNHYSYGAVGEWMYKNIAGINPLEAGYKRILLKPTIGGGLTYAKGQYESVHGLIVSEWELEGGRLKYHCVVPVNTDAVLYLPTAGTDSVSENSGFAGVTAKGVQRGATVYELVSGEYWFEADM